MAFNFLIIDDSSIVRKVFLKTLGMTDIETTNVYQANNGLEGLEILKNNWVDLIFLDINMPVMDGIEFIRQLRTEGGGAVDTPVIVISTEGSRVRKAELADQDVKAYLRKPVTPEVLAETVKTVLLGGGVAV